MKRCRARAGWFALPRSRSTVWVMWLRLQSSSHYIVFFLLFLQLVLVAVTLWRDRDLGCMALPFSSCLIVFIGKCVLRDSGCSKETPYFGCLTYFWSLHRDLTRDLAIGEDLTEAPLSCAILSAFLQSCRGHGRISRLAQVYGTGPLARVIHGYVSHASE